MIRFNHMEITVPPGFVAADGENLFAFFEEVLGFERAEFPGLDFPSVVVKTDPDASQFLFIAENAAPLAKASEDHLGMHLDSAIDVEAALARCRIWEERDTRIEIRDLGTLDLEATSTRAFYVRYLLPIWFDVQNIAAKPGYAPSHGWKFVAR